MESSSLYPDSAGPERVADWLADTSTLPWETRDFVWSITGAEADSWAEPDVEAPAGAADADEECASLVARLKLPGEDLGPTIATVTAPWGVQVAGHFSRARVMRTYAEVQRRFADILGEQPPMVIGSRMHGRGTRIFYRARVPTQTREEANRLCDDIRAAGGSCVVLKT